jgi:hypothetical protein
MNTMATPSAKIKIEILALQTLASMSPASGVVRYARGFVQFGAQPRRFTGRSRPIPDSGGTFDLTAEAVPWIMEIDADPGPNLTIGAEVLLDRGDVAPPTPVLVQDTVADPWSSGVRTLGSGPELRVRLTTRLVGATNAAFIARASPGGTSGTLTVPQSLVVEISDIVGLYKPDLAAAIPNPASRHVLGYVSDDDQGRIFTNRLANGTWASDTQFIDVNVRITGIAARVIPLAAKVLWTVIDADDPTNDSREFHRDWGPVVDPNDYSATRQPLGAHDGDTTAAFSPGNANSDLLFGAVVQTPATARWAQLPGGPAVSPSSRTRAESAITGAGTVSGTSGVRIHCPNVLGTTLIVKAELSGVPAGIPVHGASTGVLTMWSRIDVQVVRMDGAHSVSGALPAIPRFFLPACVQLDFQAEQTVTGALDRAEMATAGNLLTASTRAWVNNSGVFTHAGQGGWFFLGAARFPNPLPSGTVSALHSGTSYVFGTTGLSAWVRVQWAAAAAPAPQPDYVTFRWTDSAGTAHSAGFGVRSSTVASGETTIVLDGNDVTPLFTGHDADGSLPHAYRSQRQYYPRHELPAGATALAPGGFGIPNTGASIEVLPPGAVFVTGISPSVPSSRPPSTGTGRFFAGRTVLFTHTSKFSTGAPPVPRSDFDRRVLSTVVHEFLHAFGMPHKCGYWDWRTPRVHSCCMNYFDTWLVDASFHLIPGTVRRQGDDMCGRHLMEVRRVHLERNPGLNW